MYLKTCFYLLILKIDTVLNFVDAFILIKYLLIFYCCVIKHEGGCPSCDRLVVRFTTTWAIDAYHH